MNKRLPLDILSVNRSHGVHIHTSIQNGLGDYLNSYMIREQFCYDSIQNGLGDYLNSYMIREQFCYEFILLT